MKITSRQVEILDFIKISLESGHIPTVKEIGEGVFLSSTSTVQQHLNKLKFAGLIDWVPNKARTIRIVTDGDMSLDEIIKDMLSELEGIKKVAQYGLDKNDLYNANQALRSIIYGVDQIVIMAEG